MKFALIALLFAPMVAMAKPTLLSNRVVNLPVEVSAHNLRLSSAGYSSAVLKVVIPDLADITILDHRNPGESGPCMATYQTLRPEDIIQGRPGREVTPFTVSLFKEVWLEGDRCQVALTEVIETTVRGFSFIHTATANLPSRHRDDCR